MAGQSPEPEELPASKLIHRCPVCGVLHAVRPARAEVAYGRQLTCSPECEGERRRRARAPYKRFPGPVAA